MSEKVEFCRICLATEVPMTAIAGTTLQLVYERLTNTPLSSEDLCVSACYICSARLRRSHALMETAATATRMLTDLVTTNKVTKSTLSQVTNLHGTLAISPTKHIDIEIDATVPTNVSTVPDNIDTVLQIATVPIHLNASYVDGIPNVTSTVPPINNELPLLKGNVPVDVQSTVHADDKTVSIDVQPTVQCFELELTPAMVHVKVEIKEEPLEYDETPVSPNVIQNDDEDNTTDDGDENDDDDNIPLRNISEQQHGMVKEEISDGDPPHAKEQKRKATNKPRKYTKNETGEGLTCEVCHRAFKFECELKRHLSMHTDGRPYACKQCNLSFKLKSHLKRHLNIHTGDKPHSCDICQRQFRDMNTLREHLKHHTGEKPFRCDICDRNFAQRTALRRHITKVHNSLGRHACNLCQFRGRKKAELAVHMRSHTGDELFSCDVCESTFIARANLKKHMKKRHENAFKCDICLRMFSQVSSYEEHLKSHSGERPFECTICQSKFRYDYHLASHMKVHKEKRFECEICSRRFARKLHLECHSRVHTGERPYECHLCQRRFGQPGSLRFHLKTHVGDVLPAQIVKAV